jgi:hypothetical protein
MAGTPVDVEVVLLDIGKSVLQILSPSIGVKLLEDPGSVFFRHVYREQG